MTADCCVFKFLLRSAGRCGWGLTFHALLVILTLPSVTGNYCLDIDVREVKCMDRSVLAPRRL